MRGTDPPATRRRRADAAAVDPAGPRAGAHSENVRSAARPGPRRVPRPPSRERARRRAAAGEGSSARRWPRRSPTYRPHALGAAGPGRRPRSSSCRRAAAWKQSGGGRLPAASTAGSGGRSSSPTRPAIVRRYLRGVRPGPAADVTAWSGVTRLGPVLAAMDDLVRARGRRRPAAVRRTRRPSSSTRTRPRRCGCSAPTTTSGSPTPAATG